MIATASTSLYRSRLSVAASGFSPMLTAAQPLLILFNRVLRLPDSSVFIHSEDFKTALSHEFQVFKTRLQQAYPSPLIREQAENIIQQAFTDMTMQSEPTRINPEEPALFAYVRQLMKQTEQPDLAIMELAYVLLSLVYYPSKDQSRPDHSSMGPLLEKLYTRLKHQKHQKPNHHSNQTLYPSYQRFRTLLRKQSLLSRFSHLFWLKPTHFLRTLLVILWFSFVLVDWHLNHVARTVIEKNHPTV